MAKYAVSKDKLKHRIALEEIERINKLIQGHKRILEAIGKL